MQPPIPYPGPPEPVIDEAKVFKVKFWPYFNYNFSFSLVPILVFFLPSGAYKVVGLTLTSAFLVLSTVTFFVALLLTAFGKEVGRVIINDKGIRGSSFWGAILTLRWEDVKNVKFTRFGGNSFIRIFSFNQKHVLWLPLFIKDLKSMRDTISHFAPASNPLREYLEHHIK